MIDESAYVSHERLVKGFVYRKVTEITFFVPEINECIAGDFITRKKHRVYSCLTRPCKHIYKYI